MNNQISALKIQMADDLQNYKLQLQQVNYNLFDIILGFLKKAKLLFVSRPKWMFTDNVYV